jgi:hypothetical protein
MKFGISQDARPQALTLLLAAVLSIALWFIPYADVLSYPFRIFVTFIHEGGHALAALVTGNSVQSLSVAMNASGETYTTQGGMFSQMLVSSAGYLGAMAFGSLLLVLIRRAVAARIVLAGSAVLILVLTTIFGFITPMVAGSWGSLSGIPFTFFAGIALAAGLFAVARFASLRVATFVLSLLAVQCVLNALLDLKTVFFLSSPLAATTPSDAANMAAATGIPAVIWTIIWIVAALGILLLALRLYVAARERAFDRKKGAYLPAAASAEWKLQSDFEDKTQMNTASRGQ